MRAELTRSLHRAAAIAILIFLWVSQPVLAQTGNAADPDATAWIQIESLPSLTLGQTRAQDYARTLADVNGFDLGNGWYGILLGPYRPDEAVRRLQEYLNTGRVPRDSYLTAAGALGQRFWPVSQALPGTLAPVDDAAATTQQTPAQPRAQPAPQTTLPEETRAEALRGERLLTAEERMDLQRALHAEGVYNAGIDGAFGPGTRGAMRDWQFLRGYDGTGILTTRQRAELMEAYNAPLNSVGMERVADLDAGIAIQMPLGAVEFGYHEAPFSHYDATGSVPGAQVVLISQKGDRASLYGLYDILQTLEAVPAQGPRDRSRDAFTIEGRNARIVSFTEVTLENGEIKGFMLVWPAGDEARRERVLAEMRGSFERLPGTLDPAAGADREQRVNLVSGLEIRRPKHSRSGVFVDRTGAVMTTAEAVAQCGRITLDERFPARIIAQDNDLGLAILRPEQALAPMNVAEFDIAPPRLRGDVAVSGYSFGGVLGAPSLTFGTVADVRGPTGSNELLRLDLQTRDGDAGGPVLDLTGAVVGIVLAKSDARRLPENVSLAVNAQTVTRILGQAGLSAQRPAVGQENLPSDLLARKAIGMTALVGCWD
ncbi:serine protease [Chachezhania sediminis]|uniref:serine protease n=1 Tax=Chachezhania sediminis TaxID=2599291 RepID=UPI00131BB364|nr:serine protease [Chachezhania sediminis]